MQQLSKLSYIPPVILQQVEVLLETDLLGGSVDDWVNPVETAGQKTGGEYDATASGNASLNNWYD